MEQKNLSLSQDFFFSTRFYHNFYNSVYMPALGLHYFLYVVSEFLCVGGFESRGRRKCFMLSNVQDQTYRPPMRVFLTIVEYTNCFFDFLGFFFTEGSSLQFLMFSLYKTRFSSMKGHTVSLRAHCDVSSILLEKNQNTEFL